MYLQMIHFHWNQFKKEIYYFGRYYICGCIADVFMAFADGRKVDDIMTAASELKESKVEDVEDPSAGRG